MPPCERIETTTPVSYGSMNTNPAPSVVARMANTSTTITPVVTPRVGWRREVRTTSMAISPMKTSQAKLATA